MLQAHKVNQKLKDNLVRACLFLCLDWNASALVV